MLIPTKYENIEKNILVVSSEILKLLKKKSFGVDDLFAEIKKIKQIDFESYFDCLVFLYLADFLEAQNHYVFLKR